MGNIKINITSNGTTTLATAGKYCERNVDIDVLVSGGGGGSSLLDSEGSLFMTADEEAFCVDGNDRMVDVTEFPEKPLDNVVYRKNEKKITSDGQLTYINETTSYGIPVQTDHSNGLHYKNVEVLQYTGKEEKPKAWMGDNETGEVYDAAVFCGMLHSPKSGYKIVTNMTECDDSDTETIYLVRSVNIIRLYINPSNAWYVFEAQEVKSIDSTISGYSIYYGKHSWQSLTESKDKETAYYKTLQTMNNLIAGNATEIECNTNGCNSYAFYGQEKLKTAKFLHTGNVASRGYIDTCAFMNCKSLICVVLHSTRRMGRGPSVFDGCCHINGTIDETYNPNGLKDGYIYVPLSVIDEYKTDSGWRDFASQIMPCVKNQNELYKLDTSVYTIAYDASLELECKYNGSMWVSLR